MAADDRLWQELLKTYPRTSSTNLVRDGAGLDYGSVPQRVVFVLREPNDAEGQSRGTDLRDRLNAGPAGLTWHTVARWAVGLTEDFPSFDCLTRDPDRVAAAMRTVAAINLKKLVGTNSSDPGEIHAFAFRDRDFLRKQIRLLRPTIIIACGTMAPLMWLLDPEVDSFDPTDDQVRLRDGTRMVRTLHPAAPGKGRREYDRLRKLLRNPDR